MEFGFCLLRLCYESMNWEFLVCPCVSYGATVLNCLPNGSA
uniref:Uncharacterized protein n=1 Tax=Rhizophora mucronata TaxID=61149 RepID=A0A2P2PP09_RHIMU